MFGNILGRLCRKNAKSPLGIGTHGRRGLKFVYVDYEPPIDMPVRRFATNREIDAWVRQEYGLKPTPRQIAHVKRKHPGAMLRNHSKPLPEGTKPVEVPPELEAAIEAALRHFGMI